MHESDVEELAKLAAGNHRKFDSFAWHDCPEDDENWTLVYTHNRDSTLVDLSNAEAIQKEMESFTEGDDPDAIAEVHNHWACGWVEGYAIRVYDSHGAVTKAFCRWVELQDQLADYPLLDEADHSRREYEATVENIGEIGRQFVRSPEPPEWREKVWSWLWDREDNGLESRDDQGGYPSEEAVRRAMFALDFLDTLYVIEIDDDLFFESDSRATALEELRNLCQHAELGLGAAAGRTVVYSYDDEVQETYDYTDQPAG